MRRREEEEEDEEDKPGTTTTTTATATATATTTTTPTTSSKTSERNTPNVEEDREDKDRREVCVRDDTLSREIRPSWSRQCLPLHPKGRSRTMKQSTSVPGGKVSRLDRLACPRPANVSAAAHVDCPVGDGARPKARIHKGIAQGPRAVSHMVLLPLLLLLGESLASQVASYLSWSSRQLPAYRRHARRTR